MCGAGVRDQARARASAQFEQIVNLLFRPLQPRGCHVDRVHGGRQIERDHEGCLVLTERRRLAFPGGSGSRESAERKCQCDRIHGPQSSRRSGMQQQMLQQAGIDQSLPCTVSIEATSPQPGNGERCRYQQQPPRTQEVEVAHAATTGNEKGSGKERMRLRKCGSFRADLARPPLTVFANAFVIPAYGNARSFLVFIFPPG
jgi:hypothetical protein